MIRNSTLAGGPITAGPTNVIMLENAKINTDLNLDAHLNVEVTQGLSLLQQAKLSLNGSASPLTPLRLRFLGSQFLNGTGEVVFNNSPHSIIDVGGGELKVYSPITIRTGSGGGTICLPGDTLYSDGIISSQTPGQTLTIGASTVSNGFFGRFEAINGATLDLQGTNLLNFSNGILNGGRWSVLGDSTLLFPSGNITRNAAIVDVVGENSRFDALDSIEQNAYYLHFGGGRDFETVGNFSNLGSLWIENESEISVMGDFTQSANGNLTMSLTGTDTGEFAVLDASGTAGLAGRLVIYLSGGFHPNVGDSFPILTFSAWTGQFTTLYGRDIGGGLFFDPVYSPTSLTLVVEQAGQGDSDFDGDVDLNDLSVLAANYGAQSGKLWSQGDYDGDGDVDLNDLSLLAGNYGSGEAQAFADFVAIAAVPESGFATVLLAAGMMLRRRRAA
jgi:hypothetical protein